MSDLKGKPGEVHMTLQIKRKATGKVEEVHVVGTVVNQEKPFLEEARNGSHTLNGGA